MLAVSFCGNKTEELSFVLVLIAPLQHPVVGEDLLKALIANSALESKEGFHFVSCALL